MSRAERTPLREWIAKGGNVSAAIVTDLLDALDRVEDLAVEWSELADAATAAARDADTVGKQHHYEQVAENYGFFRDALTSRLSSAPEEDDRG